MVTQPRLGSELTCGGEHCTVYRNVSRPDLQRLAVYQRLHVSGNLLQKQETFLAMHSYPLSLCERVRVRGFRGVRQAVKPLTPRPLPWGEGAGGTSIACSKRFSEHALRSSGEVEPRAPAGLATPRVGRNSGRI